jgi:hypothetical protein
MTSATATRSNLFFSGALLASSMIAAGCAPQTSSTPASGAAMPSSIIDPYLKIEVALSSDSIDDVRSNAGNIATAATALGSPAMKIDMAAVQLAATVDLAAARDRFGALSAAIVTYMDGLHLVAPEGVHVAFCPTLAKPWLQEGVSLSNPYYGPSMPTCGAFR